MPLLCIVNGRIIACISDIIGFITSSLYLCIPPCDSVALRNDIGGMPSHEIPRLTTCRWVKVLKNMR